MLGLEGKVRLLMILDGLAPDISYLTNLTYEECRVLKRKYRKKKRKICKEGYQSVRAYYISKAKKL